MPRSDAGITHNTAESWVGVLEASYLALRLPSFHRNLGKRLVKPPKLHLLDSGITCDLLGIRTPEELRLHPLRGAIMESWVCAEIMKAQPNPGAAVEHRGNSRDFGGRRLWVPAPLGGP